MPLRVCEFCGKPFNSAGSKMCSNCIRTLDEEFVKVRKYIYQNPGKTDFASIVENADVSEKALTCLMKQGLVEIEGKDGKSGNRCRICGAPLEKGSFLVCSACIKKLRSEKLLKDHETETETAEKTDVNAVSLGKKRIIPLSYDK